MISRHHTLALLTTGLLLPAIGSALAADPPPPPTGPPVSVGQPSADFTSYTLKQGTPFQVILYTPLTTRVNQVGDPIEAAISQNFYLGSSLLFSRQDRLHGIVSRVEPPIEGRNAILAVTFTDLILRNGEKLPIQAHVRTELPDHSWGGGLTPGTKPMRVTHRVHYLGEYNSVVMTGPRQMGQHFDLPPGERWTVILDQPITLVVANNAY